MFSGLNVRVFFRLGSTPELRAYYEDSYPQTQPGITFYYWLIACNDNGCCGYSDPVSGWLSDSQQGDSDSDGIPDSADNCPALSNSDQIDIDIDAVGDLCDNCPTVANSDQSDTDRDTSGNACDNCPNYYNSDQADVDDDGIGDICDICPDNFNNDCNSAGSAASYVGSEGGILSTQDGQVTIDVPAGVLSQDTSLSITDTGTYFEIGTDRGNGVALYGVSVQPEGTQFNEPIKIIFSWPDLDSDGKVDGTNIREEDLIITKDGAAISDTCGDSICPTATGCCCDMEENTFTVCVEGLSVFTLATLNFAPVIEDILGPPDPVPANTPVEFEANFHDLSFTSDHKAEWTWDDGSTSLGTVVENSGSGTVTGTHVFTEPGIYSVSLAVTDNYGSVGTAVYQYVVVYDPSAGFVTGGGWMDSPAGAYKPDSSLTGKANFGFVSRYKRGATTPTGNTEFQFHAADLNFHSDNFD
jgi:hypothetical protein